MNGEKKRRKTLRRQSFLQGALILTAGMAAVKIIGALFKIPLKYAIGEYGMGLFNVAYNFYGPIFSLATAGFPIAIARIVSENSSLGYWNEVRQIKRVALPTFLSVGFVGMVAITFAAPVYCDHVMDSRYALFPMLALAPAILFACGASVYRGYYEGLRNMAPTAASEIIEALAKLFIGLSAACFVVSKGTEEFDAFGTVFSMAPESPDEAAFLILSLAAAAAILGVTCGSVFSLLYLALHNRFQKDGISPEMYQNSPPPGKKRKTLRRLLITALPIAAGSVTMNIAGLIDATFLQSRIGRIMETQPQAMLAGYEGMIPQLYLNIPASVSTFLYGCYTLAMTVYLLIPAVTQAFGVSALPNVTEAWARGEKREIQARMESVVRITAIFCFPAGIGISALAEPITRVLYGEEAAVPIISNVLFLLGFASLATALSTPLSNLLQAVGRMDLPVKLLIVAMAIKLGVNYWLCGIPSLNIYGAAIGTFCCYLFLVLSQLWYLQRIAKVTLFRKLFLKPFACALLCGASAWLTYQVCGMFLPDSRMYTALSLGVSITSGALMYGIGLLLLDGIDKNDIRMLPKGQKIAKTLEKRGWI